MFELQVVSNTPLSSVNDIDIVAETFLVQIGYIPKGYDPKTSATDIRDSVPYRLFMDFFMRNMSKAWTVEELAALLSTTKPTVYRHVNKLKSLDLLESMDVEFDGQIRKGGAGAGGQIVKIEHGTTSVSSLIEKFYHRYAELKRLGRYGIISVREE